MGIDDLGIRKYQMDESQMAEIIWHFVDEKGTAGAVGTSVGEIALAEALEIAGSQAGEHAGVARRRVRGP